MRTVKEIIFYTILGRGKLSPASLEMFDAYYAHCMADDPGIWLDRNESAFQEVYSLLRPGIDVLDIGCGCGSESIAFASSGARVDGIDVSENRLSCARERAALFDFPGPSFSRANVFHVDRQYDLIWMNMTYHHIEPREDFGARLKAMLKPDGRVVISEVNGANPLQQALHFRQRGFKTIVTAVDETGETIPYGNERILAAGALTRNMTRAGLSKVSERFHRYLPNKRRLAGIESRLAKLPLPNMAKSHMVLVYQVG